MITKDVECKVSVNLLLAVALRLFSYDKEPLALAVIHTVLKEHPDHLRATSLYQIFTGEASEYAKKRLHRFHYDSETGMFIVVGDKGNIAFKTLEEVEKYLRNMK